MDEAQVNEALQRWRTTPGDDLKPEDYENFRSIGSACLSQGQSDKLLQFLQDEHNQVIVASLGCALLSPLLAQTLTSRQSADHCQTALAHLARTCRPKEALHSLLQLIEDTDPGAISQTVVTLLPHLQTVLLRLDADRAVSLGRCLSSVHVQLSRLPVPYTPLQELEDPYGLGHCCSELTRFTEPFVQDVKKNMGKWASTKEDEELRGQMLKFCMMSLREPLLEAQLDRTRTSPLWTFAHNIMVTLSEIREPLPDVLLIHSLRKYAADGDQSLESRACLAYLLFVQRIEVDNFPAVFSPVFILQCNMQYVDRMLCSKKESHILKGLALYTKSLEAIEDHCLPVKLLELSSFCSVSQRLCYVLRECPIKHLKESGLQVFQLFILKLDSEAKHKFFRCMMKTSNHSGIEGLIVKNIRNEVESSLKSGSVDKWFLGSELLLLLRLVLVLPKASETDLLHNTDNPSRDRHLELALAKMLEYVTIMESLNLLRYLLLRQKELSSQSDLWAGLCRLRDEYIHTMGVCLRLSRAFYLSELKALQEERKLRAQEFRAAARDKALVRKMRLNQENADHMSPEDQHQILQSALVTFDLMESLVFRIEEIKEENTKL